VIITPFRETILKRIAKVFQEEIVRIMADHTYTALTSVQQMSVIQEITTWFNNWFQDSTPVHAICESEKYEYELASSDGSFEDVETNLSRERDAMLPWFTTPR
jgi:hypothetical protein